MFTKLIRRLAATRPTYRPRGFAPCIEQLEDRRVLSTTGVADWGPAIFTPYINVQQDMANGQPLDYAAAAQAGNTKFVTLGFIDADANGKPSWDGDTGSELGSNLDQYIHTQVDNVRTQLGGDAMVSFGGEDDGGGGAEELARWVAANVGTGQTAVNQLVADYQQVIDAYGLTHIDFDIEGAAETDTAAIGLRSQALAQLQQDNPGLQIYYTLAGQAPQDDDLQFGMTDGAVNVVNSALDAGVVLSGVNLMTMDFSNYVNYFDDTPANRQFYQTDHNPGGFGYAGDDAAEDGIHSVADVVIRNANAEVTQLSTAYANHGMNLSTAQVKQLVGVTPEIGRNYTDEVDQGQGGNSNVIFSLADAQTITDYATANGIGRVSMWSLGRDQDGSGDLLDHSETNSSIAQNPYQFSQTFATFAVGATTTDTTGPHVIDSGMAGFIGGTFDRAGVMFNEAIDPATFDASDVTVMGPNGPIAVTSVTPSANNGNTEFTIKFAAQTVPGQYTVTIGPDIRDVAGNEMDQNRDGANGDPALDKYSFAKTLGAAPTGSDRIAVGEGDGSVDVIDPSTGEILTNFRPLDTDNSEYTGPVEVAVGDFNGDGTPDVFVAAAAPAGVSGLDPSLAGQVLVYDGTDLSTTLHVFTPFQNTDGPGGTDGAYTNGLNIAVGDVDGDGHIDLIAGTRGASGGSGTAEYGRLVVLSGDGSDSVIGGVQFPFGTQYQKGVVAAAGDVDGDGSDEIAVTRGGPVASLNPAVQQIKVKVLQLQDGLLTELQLAADGSTAFAPFASLTGPAQAINRDGRVAFVDGDGDGKAELVFTALDPRTNSNDEQVRVAAYSIDVTATAGAATIKSTGSDHGTYLTGNDVTDHAISRAPGSGTTQYLAIAMVESQSGLTYLDPFTGNTKPGGLVMEVLQGGVTLDGI